jgi:3-oxoadipate enol-lactonase
MLVWLDDLRLNAEISGPPHAPPLVLIHGLGLDLRLWDALLPRLSRHRVLRLDLRGPWRFGYPARPLCDGRPDPRCRAPDDQHFALKDTVVLGAGEGGLIAQGLAVKRLDLVRAMVLTGSATRFANPRSGKAASPRLRRSRPRPRRRMRHPPRPALAQRRPRWPRSAQHAGAHPPRRLAGLRRRDRHADFYQTTATLTLPTLVLAGADDRKTPPDLQRELADLVAGSQFHLLRGGSHLSVLTHAEAFAETLRGFLTRIGHF